MIYLVNFPSMEAVKGQEFKGDEALEKMLLLRGIIGTGEVIVKTFDNSELVAKDEEIASLNEKLSAKDEELSKMGEAIADLVSLVEQTSQLPKGQVPDGFSKYKGE